MSFKRCIVSTLLFASVTGISLNASAAPSAEVTLQGIITNTTCDITVNGGKSTLNVGVYKSSDFTTANTQLGIVPLKVTLSNCTAAENGNLIIQGLTSITNNDKNLFVNADADTVGFMIKNESGKQVTPAVNNPLTSTLGTAIDYSFSVGMGSTTTSPAAGVYSAPIVVAYIVN